LRTARIPVSDAYGRQARFAEENLNRILRAAAFFLFPSGCLACGGNRVTRFLRGGVCETCWETLPRPAEARCTICDEPLPAAEAARCGRCLFDPPAFRALRAAAPYRGSARRVLIAFKFGGADYLAARLAAIMRERLRADEAPEEIVAVPATSRARRRRDHAAELLARDLAAGMRVRFASRRLEKIRDSQRQSGLPLAKRAGNVRGAFRARGKPAPRVLLVDDVATSGATARECAGTLVAAGAETVDVWCFARASRDDMIADELSGPPYGI
jgi:predicted amidophosphoribosyltransferase